MDLRQLRYFQAVAHAGRIGEAARRLGVSQPALSISLRKLEEEIGAVLLVRDHRGAHLTPSGRELLAAVGQAVELLEQGRHRISGLESEPVGRFVVGCPSVLGCYLLPGFVGPLAEAHPRIELVLWTGSSRQVEAAVLAREVQLGVVTHPLSHPDLVLLELFRDEVLIVETPPAGDPAAASSWTAASARLRRRPLLLAGHVPQAMEILDRLAALGLEPARRVECGDIHLVKELALAGAGAAILPRRVAEHGHPGRLRPVHARLPVVADTIRLAYRADMHRTHAAQLVKDALVAHARAIDQTTNK